MRATHFVNLVTALVQQGIYSSMDEACKSLGLLPGEIEALQSGKQTLKLRHYLHLVLHKNANLDYIVRGTSPLFIS
ncbi:MAG: hypothetical protein ABIV51_06590 [Saprospiraceae bacterium]